MKAITVSVVALVVVVVGLFILNNQPLKYVKGDSVEVIKEVAPDWAVDEDAVKAAQDVIRKKDLEKQLKDVDAQIKELQNQRKAVTDELTTY